MDVKIKRALISVSDKTGLAEIAKFLVEKNIEIISTGGTAKFLQDKGIKTIDISEVTNFPEIMDGRVKTLHPKVHGALLGRLDKEDHLKCQKEHDITPIGLVIVNLYPFAATVAKGASYEEVIENIDIGGPSMIRSAAKNHDFVTIVTDVQDYDNLKEAMSNGSTTFEFRKKMAAKAFSSTAYYDAIISSWFNKEIGKDFPEKLAIGAERKQILRYGENPHQNAALYSTGKNEISVINATQVQGKELSYNNLNDADAALQLILEFDTPACAIIKHANPCGVACAENILLAYKNAFKCDSLSAFGGIIALNREIDKDTAIEISKIFSEVIIAPSATKEALSVLAEKKNLRVLLLNQGLERKEIKEFKAIAGGIIIQDRDLKKITKNDIRIVSNRVPTDAELEKLLFGFSVVKHVKSNAIVLVKDCATIGIGAGQMSRVDSVKNSIRKAIDSGFQEDIKSSILASDAFFPFPDGIVFAAEAGIRAIIQPGGSVKDAEVIDVANKYDLAMVFTGVRHFKH